MGSWWGVDVLSKTWGNWLWPHPRLHSTRFSMSYSKLDPTSWGPSPHLTSGSLDCSRSPASVCTDESSLHFLCRWVDEICLAGNPKWFTIRTSEPFPLNLSSNKGRVCRKNTSIDRVIFQFEGSLALIPLHFSMVFLGVPGLPTSWEEIPGSQNRELGEGNLVATWHNFHGSIMVHKGQPLLEYKAKEKYGKMISNSFQSMLDELPKLHFLSGETSKSQSGRAIPRLPWLPSSGRQILEPSFLSTKVTNYGSVKPVKPFNISYHMIKDDI